MNKENITLSKEIDNCVVEKEFTCSVCGCNFKNYVVRKLKIKTIDTDRDLRPICEPVDPTYYDVILCSNCGYGVLTMYLEKNVKKDKIDLLKTELKPYFVKRNYNKVLTSKEVIERYKLALISTILKEGATSEKAYACLKLGWVYRTIGNTESEMIYLTHAVKRFEKSFIDESFPICGLDESSFIYLIASLHFTIGNFDDAKSWIGKVLLTRGLSVRLRNKATDLKEDILKALNN